MAYSMSDRTLALTAFVAGLVAAVLAIGDLIWVTLAPGFDGLAVAAYTAVPLCVLAAIAISIGVVASKRRAPPTWARRVGLVLSVLAALPAAFFLVMVVSLSVSVPRP